MIEDAEGNEEEVILPASEQRLAEAEGYNRLLAQCRKMQGHPQYRANVVTQYGYSEGSMHGDPAYSLGDDREYKIVDPAWRPKAE